MSNPKTFAKRSSDPQLRAQTDRRRHKRFALALIGRFMRASKHEFACKLLDVSVGGAAVSSPVAVYLGEKIVAYFENLGGIEGTVARLFDGGFAIKFSVTPHKREKLAAQITWLINKDAITGLEARRHERVAVTDKRLGLELGPGMSTECQILDVSLSGASIGTEARPPIGTEIKLGQHRGRVMRHHDKGIGIEFLDIQDAEALRKHFL